MWRPRRYDTNLTATSVLFYLLIFPLLGIIIGASMGWIIGAVMGANTIKTALALWLGIAGLVIGIAVACLKIAGFLK